jgi:hypothetical protein
MRLCEREEGSGDTWFYRVIVGEEEMKVPIFAFEDIIISEVDKYGDCYVTLDTRHEEFAMEMDRDIKRLGMEIIEIEDRELDLEIRSCIIECFEKDNDDKGRGSDRWGRLDQMSVGWTGREGRQCVERTSKIRLRCGKKVLHEDGIRRDVDFGCGNIKADVSFTLERISGSCSNHRLDVYFAMI